MEVQNVSLAISTEHLTKIYGGKVIAVNDMSLQVPAGSIYGLLGPNGAGKTTTLRLLLGLQHPTAGKAEIFGHACGSNATGVRGMIGFLPTHPTLPGHLRPKLYAPHPTMSSAEIRSRTQKVWDSFYTLPAIWRRSDCVKSVKARLAFLLISKLYRQMYANTGIATDSARRKSANRWARWLAKPCLRLFRTRPMPELVSPVAPPSPFAVLGQ